MEKEKVVSRTAKRRRSSSKLWLILLIVLLFIGTALASFAIFSLLSPNKTADRDSGTASKTMMSLKDKTTIMVMGVDRRGDDIGRSDTLMVATVDPKKEKAALISVPRDTRVKISGHGYDKINHAYAYGGHTLSRRSIEGLLGVPMEHYVLIDIHAFERIIDALGGVDIDVEKRMYYEDPWDDDGGLVIDLRPGMQQMDGRTAIQYVRYRDEEGDIGRIGRQQRFMKAVVEKMATPSIILKLPAIIKEISSAVETDLSLNDMLGMVNIIRDVQKNGIQMDMVPGKPAYIDDVSYWLPDLVELRRMVARTLDVRVDDRLVETMQQEASEYESSIPDEMVIVKDSRSIPERARDNDNLDLSKVKRFTDRDEDEAEEPRESLRADSSRKKEAERTDASEAGEIGSAKADEVSGAEKAKSSEAAAEPVTVIEAPPPAADVNPSAPAAPARPDRK